VFGSSTFWRYTRLQIPGWILVAIAISWIYQTVGVSLWLGISIFICWVIKDFALYPFVRASYESGDHPRIDDLVGLNGTTVDRLAPEGYVKVRGELWRATNEKPTASLDKNTSVLVVGSQKGFLIVKRN
tara:strand:- start:366 stop:752 length:387 start_codon:yes stop_codon:yes gene_type:complete